MSRNFYFLRLGLFAPVILALGGCGTPTPSPETAVATPPEQEGVNIQICATSGTTGSCQQGATNTNVSGPPVAPAPPLPAPPSEMLAPSPPPPLGTSYVFHGTASVQVQLGADGTGTEVSEDFWNENNQISGPGFVVVEE